MIPTRGILIVEGPQGAGKSTLINGLVLNSSGPCLVFKKTSTGYSPDDPLIALSSALIADFQLVHRAAILRETVPDLLILIDRCILSNLVYTVLREKADPPTVRLIELLEYGGFYDLIGHFLSLDPEHNRILLLEPAEGFEPTQTQDPTTTRVDKPPTWFNWGKADQLPYKDLVHWLFRNRKIRPGCLVLSPPMLEGTENEKAKAMVGLLDRWFE